MESKIDEILKQLHRYLFADSQQIIVELKHYLHDFSHNEGDLGKCRKGCLAQPKSLLAIVLTFSFVLDSVHLLEDIQLVGVAAGVLAEECPRERQADRRHQEEDL